MVESKDSGKKPRKGFFARAFGARERRDERPGAEAAVEPAATDHAADPAVESIYRADGIGQIPEPEASPTFARTEDAPQFLHERSAEAASVDTAKAVDAADQLDGLTLEAFCQANNLTTGEVWRRLRAGELTGRTEKGRLLIYSQPLAAATPDGPLHIETHADSAFPPLPNAAPHSPHQAHAAAGNFLTLTGERSSSPELALLLDHLSLAKEENREILRMTQESIKKVTELSDSLVEMKDAVIDAKEAQIQAMKAQLEEREKLVRQLKQQNEDLEMLARTLTKD